MKWIRYVGKDMWRGHIANPADPVVVYVGVHRPGKWAQVPDWVAAYMAKQVDGNGRPLFEFTDDPYEHDIRKAGEKITTTGIPPMKLPAGWDTYASFSTGLEQIKGVISGLAEQAASPAEKELVAELRRTLEGISCARKLASLVRHIRKLVDEGKLAVKDNSPVSYEVSTEPPPPEVPKPKGKPKGKRSRKHGKARA